MDNFNKYEVESKISFYFANKLYLYKAPVNIMRSVQRYLIIIFTISALLITAGELYAQTQLTGKVIDAETKEAIAGATVRLLQSKEATSTDSLGIFRLRKSGVNNSIRIAAMGYKTLTVHPPKDSLEWIIELQEDSNTIEAITITRKGKYSNKNNKAVELIDLVIRHKNQNRLTGKDSLQFEQYDKLKFGFVDPKAGFKKGLLDFNFLFQNIDSLSQPGKKLLALYQEESNARVYGKKNPSKFKKEIYSQKKTEFDQRYVNNPNIQQFMNYMFQQVDVYDESIYLLNKQFLSPIADNGKLFYRYYIVDTIFNDEGYFIQLDFEPRNETDLLFKGSLQVSMDGSYAVKKANLKVLKRANLNWIKDAELNFHYRKDSSGVMLSDTTRTFITLGVGSGESLFGDRLSINGKYQLNATFPKGVFNGAPIEVLANASDTAPTRPLALNSTESQTYQNIETLNNKTSFKSMLALGYLVAQGYYTVGKFEFGPLEYLYSRNNIEGNRFRIGGRTTQALTDKAFFEGYLAYGDQDKELKYFLKSAVTLNGKSVVNFPAHYIEATVQHDILEPGMQISYLKGDSFFRSIRKNRPTKWFSTQGYQLQHVIEFGNHISLTTGFTHMDRNTVGDLQLISSGNPDHLLQNIATNEVHMDLRWAPFEKFYYRNLTRKTIIEKYPVFNVVYTQSLSGFWNSTFPYQKLNAAASKRLFLNQLGFADVRLSAGKIWGTLPYPLLELPNLRQKDDRHKIDFDLMNPMEFVADQYIKFGFYHQMQGFLFNKIPLIKKLNLREVWGANMFYGKLSDRNNPYLSDNVVQFDTDAEGQIMTHVLGQAPYWEGSVGIDNILNVLKVEYVKRLTYAGLPNVNQDRFRISININF